MEHLQNEIKLDPEVGLRILAGYGDKISYDKTRNRGSIYLGFADDSPNGSKSTEYYLIKSALKAAGMEVQVEGGGSIQFEASEELLKKKGDSDFTRRIRGTLVSGAGR